MSGLVCLGNIILDLNRVICITPSQTCCEYVVMCETGSTTTTMRISNVEYTNLKALLEKRNETDRLRKENAYLQNIIAAMPGTGEDYKTAQIEFEHIIEK